MADVNPWSAAHWSVTGQGEYLRQHGLARAQARARDAGTTLGAPRPSVAVVRNGRQFAEVAIVRPGNPPVYRFLIPPKRDDEGDVRITDDGTTRGTEGDNSRVWKD